MDCNPQRGFLNIFLVFICLIGILVLTSLTFKSQVFKPKAYENKNTFIKGTLVLIDNHESEARQYAVVIEDSDNYDLKQSIVKLDYSNKELLYKFLGQRVRIEGGFSGGVMVPSVINNIDGEYSALGTSQRKGVLVIPVKFSSSPAPFSIDEIKQRIFKAPDGFIEFFKAESFGKLVYSDDPQSANSVRVLDWVSVQKLPGIENLDCPYLEMENVAWDQTGRQLLGEYSHFMFIFLRKDLSVNQCGQLYGLATLYGNRSWFFIQDNKVNLHPASFIHEFGHNLGSDHAEAIRCQNGSINSVAGNFSDCTSISYGDFTDVMGLTGSFHFNLPHKLQLGFMADDWLLKVDKENLSASCPNGECTIYALEKAPFEAATKKVMGIRLKKADTSSNGLDQFYYLSYRGNIGLDSKLYQQNQTKIGLNIHLRTPGHANAGQSNLLDLQAGPVADLAAQKVVDLIFQDRNQQTFFTGTNFPSFDALEDGKEFYDGINKIRIKQISHDDFSVKVKISFD